MFANAFNVVGSRSNTLLLSEFIYASFSGTSRLFFRMGIALQAGGVAHGHSHGGDGPKHGHQHEGAGKENINVRAAFIHVIGDFIQSLGVLIAAFVIYYKVKSGFDWL